MVEKASQFVDDILRWMSPASQEEFRNAWDNQMESPCPEMDPWYAPFYRVGSRWSFNQQLSIKIYNYVCDKQLGLPKESAPWQAEMQKWDARAISAEKSKVMFNRLAFAAALSCLMGLRFSKGLGVGLGAVAAGSLVASYVLFRCERSAYDRTVVNGLICQCLELMELKSPSEFSFPTHAPSAASMRTAFQEIAVRSGSFGQSMSVDTDVDVRDLISARCRQIHRQDVNGLVAFPSWLRLSAVNNRTVDDPLSVESLTQRAAALVEAGKERRLFTVNDSEERAPLVVTLANIAKTLQAELEAKKPNWWIYDTGGDYQKESLDSCPVREFISNVLERAEQIQGAETIDVEEAWLLLAEVKLLTYDSITTVTGQFRLCRPPDAFPCSSTAELFSNPVDFNLYSALKPMAKDLERVSDWIDPLSVEGLTLRATALVESGQDRRLFTFKDPTVKHPYAVTLANLASVLRAELSRGENNWLIYDRSSNNRRGHLNDLFVREFISEVLERAERLQEPGPVYMGDVWRLVAEVRLLMLHSVLTVQGQFKMRPPPDEFPCRPHALLFANPDDVSLFELLNRMLKDLKQVEA